MAGEKPHSVVEDHGDGRLSAPSAQKNIAPILKALDGVVPTNGYALEIASGSGEHIVAFARAHPGVVWQPTDIETERLNSADAWRAVVGVRNMRVAQYLDATRAGWDVGSFDLVTTSNLLHLLPDRALAPLIGGVANALNAGGAWFLYGPFRRGGQFTSQGDLAFHQRLTEDDPQIGYKDIEEVEAYCRAAGLTELERIECPANNLVLVARKSL